MKIDDMKILIASLEKIDNAMDRIDSVSTSRLITDRLKGTLIELREETVLQFELDHGVYINRVKV